MNNFKIKEILASIKWRADMIEHYVDKDSDKCNIDAQIDYLDKQIEYLKQIINESTFKKHMET
jgi:hypothetical protein